MDCAAPTTKAAKRRLTSHLSGLRPRPLLPNEPCLHLPAAEQALTEQLLLPALAELEACFLAVRAQVDPQLSRLQPVKLGKAYPLGQCLEIAQAVQRRLRTVDEASLPPDAASGLRTFKAYLRAGGSFRQVWGDLRGQYFQNAFQLGSLYVDVSNDTVVPTKPKVEILPFAQAEFVPIRDFVHFREIATRYWKDQVYPNHVLPALAPHCPLIHVSSAGRIRVHDASLYVLAMTHSGAFRPSETILREAPLPMEIFERIRAALDGSAHELARTPEQGRLLALQRCRQYRAKRWHQLTKTASQVIPAVQQVNRQLAQFAAAACSGA